jgi:uncharacterized protein YdeI (YjbR/CyaY-like superfamily)
MAATSPRTEPRVLACADADSWAAWLEKHHADSPEVWLKIAKKSAEATSVSYPEALELAICHGWIDGRRRALDESFWLQRFTPRGPRSKWSEINREKATALIAAGRMHPAGLAQVEAARADGRWEAAYAPQSRITVPDDLQHALDQNPAAAEFFATLTGSRRYAFLYRLDSVRDPLRRARRIAEYIVLLGEGPTLN